MPELPEVEVTVRGIAPGVVGRRIESVLVRQADLRQPVPAGLDEALTGATVETVARRGKFILLRCTHAAVRARPDAPSSAHPSHGARTSGTLLIHLGMTGTLRVVPRATPVKAHDHVDIVLGDAVLRFNDARRFGLVLWHPDAAGPVLESTHFARLGVEPFSPAFDPPAGGALLHRLSRGRAVAVKPWLLAGEAVVGVGNIYASESLFHARIDPRTAAGRIAPVRYARLADAIRDVLTSAIARGGSTLRDFVGADGASGYFQLETAVYDREGLPCRRCGTTIRRIVQGQRSTFFCPRCQR